MPEAAPAGAKPIFVLGDRAREEAGCGRHSIHDRDPSGRRAGDQILDARRARIPRRPRAPRRPRGAVVAQRHDPNAEVVAQGSRKISKRRIGQQQAAAGVVDDVPVIAGAETGVQRYEHAAGQRHRGVAFERPVRIRREHRGTVARPEPDVAKRGGKPQAALGERRVSIPFIAVDNGGAIPVDVGGAAEKLQRRQWG